MSVLGELRELKRQERVLVNLASKISDQLNRLKVEELALVSKIRMEEGKESHTGVQELACVKTEEVDLDHNKEDLNVSLDLSVPGRLHSKEEMEEEEDEDEDNNDLTSFITELSHRDTK